MNRMRGKSKEDGSAAKHCRIRSYHRFVVSKEKPRQRELAGLLIAWVIQNPGCTPLHLMHRAIPADHKDRLIQLGYIQELSGGLRLTNAGRLRIVKGE